jgi:hypothetical protein
MTCGYIRSNTACTLLNRPMPVCRSILVAYICQPLLGTLPPALGQGSDCMLRPISCAGTLATVRLNAHNRTHVRMRQRAHDRVHRWHRRVRAELALTHTYIVVKRLCSGHDVSDPALRLPRQSILKHQDNEPLPSYAYLETLCRTCDD